MSTATSVPTGVASTPAATTSTATDPKKFTGFTVPSILTWKDPSKTGALFGQVFLTWVVLSSSLALRLFLRLSTYLLLLLSALEASTRLINGANNGLIGSYRFSRFLPREQAIQTISSTVAKNVRSILYGTEYVLDARSPALDFKLAIGAWVLYKVLGVVSVSTLTLLAIIATFILPVIYLQFKPQVDKAIVDAQAHIQVQQKKLEKAAHEKAGPQIEFVQKLLNKRGRGGLSTGSATTPGHSGASTGTAATGASTGASTGAFTGAAASRAAPAGSDTFAPSTAATGTTSASHTAPASFKTASTGSASTGSAPIGSAPIGSTSAPVGSTASTGVTAGVAPLGSGPSIPSHPTTEEVLSKYDSVPTLAGNVKLDPYRVDQFQTDAQALRDSIKQDKPAH